MYCFQAQTGSWYLNLSYIRGWIDDWCWRKSSRRTSTCNSTGEGLDTRSTAGAREQREWTEANDIRSNETQLRVHAGADKGRYVNKTDHYAPGSISWVQSSTPLLRDCFRMRSRPLSWLEWTEDGLKGSTRRWTNASLSALRSSTVCMRI